MSKAALFFTYAIHEVFHKCNISCEIHSWLMLHMYYNFYIIGTYVLEVFAIVEKVVKVKNFR